MKYNGNTVFQIDPASGNVFFGKPNDGLTAPLSGFMYRASDGVIVSKDNKVTIDDDGTLYVSDGNFSGAINATSGSFTGDLNGATGTFTGSFVTPSLESRPPKTGGTTSTVALSADANSQYTSLNGLSLVENELYNAEFSANSEIKYIKYKVNKLSNATTYRWSLLNASFTEVYYLSARSNGTKSTTIPAGTLKVGYSGDVLVFNVEKIPYSSNGLEVGQIYQNADHQLFIKTE